MNIKTITKWCSSNYGIKGSIPSIYLSKDIDIKGLYVEEDNTITIRIDSEEEMIKSIIHEYQHYLQSKDQFEMLYNMGYSYEDHPFEMVAESIAIRDFEECLKFLENKKVRE